MDSRIVVKLIKGRDDIVGAARLRAEKSFLVRANQQLCPIELSCDSYQKRTKPICQIDVLHKASSQHSPFGDALHYNAIGLNPKPQILCHAYYALASTEPTFKLSLLKMLIVKHLVFFSSVSQQMLKVQSSSVVFRLQLREICKGAH